MERLLADAEKLSGIEYDISSYADITEAIHVVQTEMGITGTTAAEAASTIEGSMASAKAAWGNLVTGIADENANLESLINQFVESVGTAAGNIIPRVQQILLGIGSAMQTLGPLLSEQIPAVIAGVLPSLVSAGSQLIVALVTGLIGALPELASSVPEIIGVISSALSESLPDILSAGEELLTTLKDGVISALPNLTPAAIDALLRFVETLTDPGNLSSIIDSALEIIAALADGLVNSIPALLEKAPVIVSNLVDSIVENAPKLLTAAWELVTKLASGIIDNLPEIGKAAGEIVNKVETGVTELKERIKEVGWNIVTGVFDGIQEKYEWLRGKVGGFFSNIIDATCTFLGINSPSKVFRDEVGQYIALGVAEGIADKTDDAVKAADKMAKDVYSRSKDWADKNAKYMALSYEEQAELWETIQSQFIKGSKQYSDAEEEIFDLRAKAQEEYQKEAEASQKKYLDSATKVLEAFKKKGQEILKENEELQKQYQDTLAKRTSEIFNSFGLFDEIPEREEKSGTKLIENLRGQIDSIQSFYDSLTELEERGAASALVDEIRGMGVGAADELAALLSLTEDQLSEYSNLYGEKQELANNIALEELEGLKAETETKIQENLDSLKNLYIELAPGVGTAFADGLAQGILSGLVTVADAAEQVARVAIEASMKALDEHSPSKLAEKIGLNFDKGLSNGLLSGEDMISRDVNRILDFGTANVDFASSGLGMSSAAIVNSASGGGLGANGPITLNIPVMLQDGTALARALIPDLIKVASAAGTPIVSTGYA